MIVGILLINIYKTWFVVSITYVISESENPGSTLKTSFARAQANLTFGSPIAGVWNNHVTLSV